VNFTFTDSDWKTDYEAQPPVHATSAWTCVEGEHQEEQKDNEYIWTYEFGEDDKPKLVIVHGYGGSGIVFYKMFERLKQHFHVYLIDLLGMGRSSRNDFRCDTYEE